MESLMNRGLILVGSEGSAMCHGKYNFVVDNLS